MIPTLCPPLVVGLSLLCLLLQALGVLRGPLGNAAWLAHLAAAGYLVGASAVGMTRLGGESLTDRLLNAVVLITMHLSWGAGFLRGVAFGAERTVDRSRVK